jgi:hypothetical protein
MADISNVRTSEIKEISDSLEALSCKCNQWLKRNFTILLTLIARILTRVLYWDGSRWGSKKSVHYNRRGGGGVILGIKLTLSTQAENKHSHMYILKYRENILWAFAVSAPHLKLTIKLMRSSGRRYCGREVYCQKILLPLLLPLSLWESSC